MRLFCTTLVLMATGAMFAPVAAQDRPLSIAVTGSYTTSSKIFYRPNDPDEFLRSQYFPLDNIAGVGIDVRYALPAENLQLGLSAEYLSRSTSSDLPHGSLSIPVEDGIVAVPLELTGYFFIPVGTPELRIFMGGGGGLYIGQRRYAYAGVPAETTERGSGAGIHVLSGVEWRVSPALSVRSLLKFRDVQFETVNRFLAPTALFQGSVLTLSPQPMASRINIDGMVISAGLAYHF